MSKRGRQPIAEVLEDLAKSKNPPLDALRALSDLSGKPLADFAAGWPNLPRDKRLATLQALGELAEDTLDLNINAASRVALNDSDAQVRAAAIHNLWEDQSADLIDPFLNFLTQDSSEAVRAAAATALGIYVYLGEMEELPEDQTKAIENALLAAYQSEDTLEVRRRALESLGFSPRPEAAAVIDQAYENGDDLLRASALFAMGRTLDPDRWGESVIGDLTHATPQVRFEAVRASGELQLEEAVVTLGQLLHDSDATVQEMTVWALGEIGGDDARRFLQDRLETADEELTELIEDALANADLVDGVLDFGMLDVNDDDEDEQARKARLN
jgi:HEAT repeat protein